MIVDPKDYDALEAEADELLRVSLVGITKYSEKADILTVWKEKDRRQHEVLGDAGWVAPHRRQGTYGRTINFHAPHLNSREGIAGFLSHRPRPLHAYMVEQGYLWRPGTPPEQER